MRLAQFNFSLVDSVEWDQFSPADLQDDELDDLCFELVARAAVVPESRVEGAGGGELEDDGERVGADADEGHDVRVAQVDQDVQLLLVARGALFSAVGSSISERWVVLTQICEIPQAVRPLQ